MSIPFWVNMHWSENGIGGNVFLVIEHRVIGKLLSLNGGLH